MSLNDLSFDEGKLGTYAAGLNYRLGELRTQLFTAFHEQADDAKRTTLRIDED